MNRLPAALAVAILGAGWIAVVQPLETQIAGRDRALAEATAAIDARRAVAGRLQAALAEQARVRAALAPLHLDAGRTASLARFLGIAVAAANRHGADVGGLQSGSPGAPPEAAVPAAAGTPPAFDELPYQLTLRGSYAAVLATIRDLTAAPVAARVSIDGLAPEDRGPSAAPRLLAAVGIVLLRVPAESHVRTEPR